MWVFPSREFGEVKHPEFAEITHAISTKPWPYAFDFTMTITETSLPTCFWIEQKLCKIARLSTSTHVLYCEQGFKFQDLSFTIRSFPTHFRNTSGTTTEPSS